jgi:hypothetical protein
LGYFLPAFSGLAFPAPTFLFFTGEEDSSPSSSKFSSEPFSSFSSSSRFFLAETLSRF